MSSAEASEAQTVLCPGGRSAEQVHHRAPARAAARWRTTLRKGSSTIRPRARPPGPARARRLDRPHRARRQPVEDDRRPGRAWRRASELVKDLGVTPIWRNHTGNQRCRPARDREARDSLDALIALVRRAESEGNDRARGRRRATPGRTSPSPTATWSRPTALSGVTRRARCATQPHRDAGPVAGAGARRHAPAHPQRRARRDGPRAARTWAATTRQTIAGVCSTSTHGSGLDWGPFPDLVRSLDLVVAAAGRSGVEPAGGPDRPRRLRPPGARARPGRRASSTPRVCGIGTLGPDPCRAARGAREVLAQRGAHALHLGGGARTLTEDGVLGEGDHYELFLNPYAGKDGKHRVLVTRREDCPEPVGAPPGQARAPPTHRAAGVAAGDLRAAALPRPSPALADGEALRRGARRHVRRRLRRRLLQESSTSARPTSCPPTRWSSASPLDGDRHIEAVDRILEIAKAPRADEGISTRSPISLRFVGPSGPTPR